MLGAGCAGLGMKSARTKLQPDGLVTQLGGRETIWASSTMRKRPEQTFEVQTIGAPPKYWTEVIRPGDPHKGQASTATKLEANASRREAKSSRKTMSPGAISAIDDRFDICRSVRSCSARPELGTPRTPSRSDRGPGFRGLLLCFATAIKILFTAKTRRRAESALTAPCQPAETRQQMPWRFPFPAHAPYPPAGLTRSHLERGADRAHGGPERIPNRNFRANSGKGTEVRILQAK